MAVSVPVESLTTKQTLHEILRTLQRTEDSVDPAWLLEVAAQINANTQALASLTTNPPVVSATEQTTRSIYMTVDPIQAVRDALATQSDAVANVAAELATEHQQWLDAVAAGDTAQATAIVADVEANTAKLNDLVAQLQASDPSAPPADPEDPPVDPVEPPA